MRRLLVLLTVLLAGLVAGSPALANHTCPPNYVPIHVAGHSFCVPVF